MWDGERWIREEGNKGGEEEEVYSLRWSFEREIWIRYEFGRLYMEFFLIEDVVGKL